MPTEALLVMDVQNGIVERFAEQADRLLDPLAETIAAARAVEVPVIYVRVAFREGMPEVSRRNLAFSALVGARPRRRMILRRRSTPRLRRSRATSSSRSGA